MKTLALALGALLLLALAYFGAILIASESGEVLEIHTTDADGEEHVTRIWVIDEDGTWWVRGTPGTGWMTRVEQSPRARAVRGGETREVTAVSVPEARERLNAAFAAKYGWADAAVGLLLFDRERAGARVLRLDPR